MTEAQAGQLTLVLSPTGRRYLIRLQPGQALHTDLGLLRHDDLIGGPLGRTVRSHRGDPFYLLRPSLHDLAMGVKRATQIVYPKDAGYVLLKLNVVPGSRVLEVGTGSGALTLVLASAVGPEGRVYSFEARAEMQELARRNLERVGLEGRVDLHLGDAAEGFDLEGLDAAFVDVREPWRLLEPVRRAVVPGGFFGSLVPTTNQVSELLAGLESQGYVDAEACELLLREYKTVPARLRPLDRLTAHTGYLLFARTPPLEAAPAPGGSAEAARTDGAPGADEGQGEPEREGPGA